MSRKTDEAVIQKTSRGRVRMERADAAAAIAGIATDTAITH